MRTRIVGIFCAVFVYYLIYAYDMHMHNMHIDTSLELRNIDTTVRLNLQLHVIQVQLGPRF